MSLSTRLPVRSADLLSLLRRIADEDRAALAELRDELTPRLTERLRAAAFSPRLAGALVAATFVEVWWSAPYNTAPEAGVRLWVVSIVARRAEDWKRVCLPVLAPTCGNEAAVRGSPEWVAAGVNSYYLKAEEALAAILDPSA